MTLGRASSLFVAKRLEAVCALHGQVARRKLLCSMFPTPMRTKINEDVSAKLKVDGSLPQVGDYEQFQTTGLTWLPETNH